MIDTIVFLGPTLSVEEAIATLPGALYLPPAACGDIIKVLRLKPKTIILIDGFFEQTPAVWHKEILLAMEYGVAVYGAASMGALRAAELKEFGMKGLGKIYEDFATDVLSDDDEVAVMHLPASHGFQAISDAMVNIRATVAKSLASGVIDSTKAQQILTQAKSTFYPDRKLSEFNQTGWVEQSGYVDQKKIDAQAVLQFVKNVHFANSPVTTAPKTMLLRMLMHKQQCEPFRVFHEQFPEVEKLASLGLLLPTYPYLKALAELLSTAHRLHLGPISMEILRGKTQAINLEPYLLLMQVLYSNEQNSAVLKKQLEEMKAEWQGVRGSLSIWCATLLAYVDQALQSIHFEIKQEVLLNYSNRVRRKLTLVSANALQEWLSELNWSAETYTQWVAILARYDFMVLRQHLDIISQQPANEVSLSFYWFGEALVLTEQVQKIHALLKSPFALSELLQQVYKRLEQEGIKYVYQLGFASQAQFEYFLNQVKIQQGYFEAS